MSCKTRLYRTRIHRAVSAILVAFGTLYAPEASHAQTAPVPVLYWSFDDLQSSGLTQNLGSGGINDGLLYRGATFTSDTAIQNPGLALSIPDGTPGAHSYLKGGINAFTRPSAFNNRVTVAICAQVQPGPGEAYILSHTGEPPLESRKQLAVLYNYPVAGRVSLFAWGGSAALVGNVATTPDDGLWHHYAFTYDGSTLRGYTDGVFTGSMAYSAVTQLAANNSGSWYVGAANSTEGAARVGAYDEVRVYSSALTAGEVEDIASVCAPLPEVPDSDGDGVPDDQDAFPNDATETTDTDGDGVGDNGDAFPTNPNESADTDGDTVGDNGDLCATTVYDTMELNPNQWALRAGSTNFIQGLTRKGTSSGGSYSIAQTRGCSCTDIVAAAGLGNGHLKKGCSNSVMADWVAAAQAHVAAAPADLGAYAAEDEFTTGLPTEFALEGNYPNPFNPVTTIRFAVPETAAVSLAVYDMMGRQVRSLVSGTLSAGSHEVSFDARELPSGTYLYRLSTPAGAFNGRMLLVK